MTWLSTRNFDSYRARFLGAMVAVVLLGFVAMVLINRYFGERMIRSHAEALAGQGLQRVVSQLRTLTGTAVQQSEALEEIVAGQGETIDPVAALLEMAPLFINNDAMTYAGVAVSESGHYAFLQRTADREVVMRHYGVDDGGERIITDTRLDSRGRPSAVQVSPGDGYDPRQRPFYLAVEEAGARVWTDSYLFPGNAETPASAGVTLASPVHDATGRLRAVVDVDFGTVELSRFVRQLQEGVVGRVFVLEQRRDETRRVVVHSGYLETDAAWSGNLDFDPLVAAASRAFPGAFSVLGRQLPPPVLIDVGGAEFLASTRLLEGDGLPDWMVVSVLPMAIVREDLLQEQQAMLVALAVIAVVGVGFSWLLAAGLNRPLRKLADQVERLSEGRPMNRNAERLGPVEVTQLAAQFHVMAERVASRERMLVAAEAEARGRAERVQRAHEAMLAAAQEVLDDQEDARAHFDRLLELINRAMKLRQVLLWQADEARDGMARVGLRGEPAIPGEPYLFLRWEEMPLYRDRLADDGRFVTADAAADPALAAFYARRTPPAGRVALLDVAIKAQGRMAGILSLQRLDPTESWSHEEQLLARGMADIVSLMWERDARRLAEESLRRQVHQIGRVNEVMQATARLLAEGFREGRDNFGELVRICAEQLGITRVSVWQRVRDTPVMQLVRLYDRETGEMLAGVEVDTLRYPAYWARMRQAGQVITPDMANDDRTRRMHADHFSDRGRVALLDTGVILQEAVVGIISFRQVGEIRPWTPEDEIAARAVAEMVALLFERQARLQAEEQFRRQAQRLLRANDITHDVALTLAQSGLADGIEQVLASSLELLQAWRVSVWRVCNAAGDIELVSLKCVDGDPRCGAIVVPRAEHGEYWQSLERDGRVVIADAASDPRTRRIYRERLHGEGRLSFLDLGVVVGGRVSGLFSVHRREGSPWSAEDELLARAMTDLLAFAFEREARHRAEQMLEAQANRLVRNSELIAALTRELNLIESIEEGLQRASQFCGEALELDYVVVWLGLDDRRIYDQTTVFEVATRRHQAGIALPSRTFSGLNRQLQHERCVVVPDSSQDPIFREYFEANLPHLPAFNLLITSIASRERIVGLLCAQSRDLQRRWTAEERLFLSAVADVVSLRMETLARRQAEDVMRRRSERISILNTALSRVATDPVVHGDRAEEALRRLTTICLDGLNPSRVSVWIRHADPDRLELHHRISQRRDLDEQRASFRRGDIPGFLTALERNRHLEINDTANDPLAAEFDAAYFRPHRVASVLCTPVRLRGELSGMLCIESVRHRRSWTEEEKIFNGAIADMVASVFEGEARRIAEMENEEARERIRMLIERTPLAAIDWDRSMRIRGWNPAAERIFGVPAREALGRKAWFLVPDSGREIVIRGWREVLRRQNSFVARVRNLRGDGSTVICDWHNSLLTDTGGRAIGISSLVEDVTERVQAEEAVRELNASLERRVGERTVELQSANERLKEVDRLKSEFLATMSHELRTPLNSIIGFSKILKQGLAGPLNEEQTNQISRVHAAGVHLLGLINDLLDLSKIEAGRMRLAVEKFNPARLLVDLEHLLVPMVAVKDLEFVVRNEAPDVEIVSDPTRVYQILVNLATNAVKFTQRGNVTVRMFVDGERLGFAVSDTGMGIEADKLDRLFEAFRQVDGSARRHFEGTGLGLYLSRKIVTMLGGAIGVDSTFGRGSTFHFWLPLGGHAPEAGSQPPFNAET